MAVNTTKVEHSYHPGSAMAAEALADLSFTNADDIVVELELATAPGVRVPLERDADYVVTVPTGSSWGTVRALAGYGALDWLHVRRVTPLTQEVQFAPFDVRGPSIEEMGDKLLRIAQEQDEAIGRTIQVPRGQVPPLLAPEGLSDGDLLEYRDGALRRFDRAPFAGKFYAGDVSGRPVPASGTGADAGLREDMAGSAGAQLLGTASGRSIATVLAGLASVFIKPTRTITAIQNDGDSFSVQPSPHFGGNSTIKQVADALGATLINRATSGATSADAQAGIFVAGSSWRQVASNPSLMESLLTGQNDAIHLGATSEALRRERIATLDRIRLADMAWKAIPHNRKVLAGAASSGSLTVSGTWESDNDIAPAFKAGTPGSAQMATLTNARGFICWYGIKVGSTGRAYIREERDEVNAEAFRTQGEANWVPSNFGQDWAIEARIYDAGEVLPELLAQFVVHPDSGGDDVTLIGFAPFTGQIEVDYPMLAVGDVSRWSEAAYAAQGNGITTNVRVVNNLIRNGAGRMARIGANVQLLPFSQNIGPSSGLHTDGLHPSAFGAEETAADFVERIGSGTPFAGEGLDALLGALLQGTTGEARPGVPLRFDAAMRMVVQRLGGSGLRFPATDNVIPMSTSGIYLVPESAAGVAEVLKGLLLLATGNDGYLQSRIGDLVLGSAGSNRVRVRNNSLDPEVDEAYSLGSEESQYAAVWSLILNLKPIHFANLAEVTGNLSIIDDCSTATPGAVAAAGGDNEVLVRRTGAGTWVVVG